MDAEDIRMISAVATVVNYGLNPWDENPSDSGFSERRG